MCWFSFVATVWCGTPLASIPRHGRLQLLHINSLTALRFVTRHWDQRRRQFLVGFLVLYQGRHLAYRLLFNRWNSVEVDSLRYWLLCRVCGTSMWGSAQKRNGRWRTAVAELVDQIPGLTRQSRSSNTRRYEFPIQCFCDCKLTGSSERSLLKLVLFLTWLGTVYWFSKVLGDEKYDELCQDRSLVLEEIWYCQSELGSVGKSLQPSRRLKNPNFHENKQVSLILSSLLAHCRCLFIYAA